ncbi:MAG: Trm112 family protein [Bacteroidota bacterium]
MISKELLDILCCPETKADLVLDGNTLVSTDQNTRRRYRIEDDIPIMLIEESEVLDMEEWKSIMKKHGKLKESE